MWYAVYAVFGTVWLVGEGVRLYPCGDAGYQDVKENTPLTFYCDQYTGSVGWTFKPVSGNVSPISACSSTCTPSPVPSWWTPRAISSTNSSLTTSRTARSPAQSGGRYRCDTEQCGLHVFVPAVVSQPTSPVINRQDSGYTLSASVSLTRLYSSRGLYSCLWQLGSSRQSPTPDLSPPAADTSNTADRTGRCDVTMPFPDTSGTYPCSVTVTPGNTQRSCGSLTITRPSPPTLSCPSDFIAENTPLTCTCNTADIGQPGGRLRWFTGTGSDISTEVINGSYYVSTLDMTWTVRRGDDNRKFGCLINWTVNVTAQSDYTARVAYGPDTVSVQGNTPFYTDTTGSQTMTLTCQAGGVNPSSALVYNWDVLCEDRQQSTCTFRPRPGPSGDDNRVITCTVTNTKNNNNTQHNSVTLDIKYPPLSAPHISGYVNGQALYEGDSLTLTCAVAGGDPVVTSVTLTCPGLDAQKPTPGQSSSLAISRLSGSDHTLTCVCSGQWVRESYYALTDSRTLTVYYPPSTPTITRTDGKSRPALEGDTVSLTCSLTSFGHPSAERTWVSERSNAKDPLQLGKVGRGDNNRTVTCQASNDFTQRKGQPLMDTFVLHVYYGPYITVQPREDNSCAMTSDGTSCHVTEGQGVHLQCKADSNPAPQDCTWRFLSGSGIVLDTGTNLDLVSANRTDSGVYQVEVRTTKPDLTDDRLPRTASSNLTVLVTYPPTDTHLTVNNSVNVTVNEKEAVTLTCQSRGRPTPGLELLQRDAQLARQDGGQLSLSEEITQLSYHTAARCDNTGTLTCRADNGVGSVQDVSVQLYVNCKPRHTTTGAAALVPPPKMTFLHKPVSTAFHLQAFPLPDSFAFQYLGPTQDLSNRQPVPDGINLTARCATTFAAFAVQCTVSVNSAVNSTAEGFYTFAAANAFGEEQFVFQVTVDTGVRLYPCGDAGYQDVEENTPLTFYCDQYTGSVEWKFKPVSGGLETPISVCSSTCTASPVPSWWTPRATSSTSSSLTTSRTARSPAQSGARYLCDTEQCGLHVFVPAEVSEPTPPVINRQDSGYTLSASVSLTRLYSSRGLYSCLWQLGSSRQSPTPDLSPPAADTSNTADRTGRCDVTMSLPDTSGTYPCGVTVTPGNTQRSCGNLTITRPSPPTLSCPSDFIAENTPLTCTCNTANIGQPGGRLRWFTGTGSDISTEVISGTYDVSTLDMTRTVRRGDDNNRKFRCVINWTVNVTAQSDYTARVAYGPDTVSIQGNTPFYTDTTGSQRMTLTCQAGGVNPSSALTYNWDVLCDDRQQSTCTFRPRPGPSGDDNTVITCTVTNTKNNNNRQHNSVTLDIKYPPLSAPNISGYVNGQVLYEGDSLTLTCAVTGGDPVVTSVTLTCPGRQVQNSTPGQSSSLVISRLNGSDHNLTCVCRGQWVRESYYTLTDSRTLTVYYPPSTPTITRTDGKSRPALEGDTVSLTCSLTSFGHPSAQRTWVSERSNAKDPLLLGNVGRGDNNRTVTCQASNDFTQRKGQPLMDTFLLHVYYGPYITVQPREDNSCAMTSDGTSCHVTEGQGVHLQCKADSNPAPQDCTWRFLNGSGIVLDTGTNLDLVAANRTDSGVYQVEVKTTKPDVTDDRLPRTAGSNLTLLVTYPPTHTHLTVNNSINITVNEKEAVTLTCQSRGRPTPGLELLQRDAQLARQDGGQLSLSEEITQLSHHTAARCDNTGTLTCRADNRVGSVQDISVQLYVNCKPRRTTAAPAPPPKINFIHKPVSTAFHLQAFPLPDSFTFQYLGTTQNFNSRQPVPDSINVTARCTNTFAAFAVQCNVSVNSAKDSSAEGFYTFTAANAFGQEQFVFQVTVNGPTDSSSSPSLGTAAVVGVTVAVVVVIVLVLVLVYVLVLWRRHWILPCAAAAEGGDPGQQVSSSRSPKAERGAEAQSGCPLSDVYELMEDGSPRHTTEVQPSSVYTSLQTSDIGVPSVYSQVTAYQNVGARLPQGVQPSSVYTSLQTSDIGVPSVYSQVTAYQNVGARLPQDPAYENCEAGRRAVDENSGARKTGAYVNLPCQR